MKDIDITEMKDFKVGHAEDMIAGTGCTAIICPAGAVAGVDVRGGGPASRETELLRSDKLVEQIQAVMLSGGSAYGLEAAGGAMQFLEEKALGFDVGVGVVPIVCSACLFDLAVGSADVRPDKQMGYTACQNAWNVDKVPEGCVGAGTGATVGKYLGADFAMKSGIGIYAVQLDELQLAAIVAVNALGDVYTPDSTEILAGLLNEEKTGFRDTEKTITKDLLNSKNLFAGNTTIGCIITNAKLDKPGANRLAAVAHNGLARTIKPVHTAFDGDSLFVMAAGSIDVFATALEVLAVEVTAKAVERAVLSAHSLFGLPAAHDIK